MITVLLNGECQTVSHAKSLQQLLAEHTGLPEKYAIAVNGCFIPRPEYLTTIIEHGDEIELLVPMQGG